MFKYDFVSVKGLIMAGLDMVSFWWMVTGRAVNLIRSNDRREIRESEIRIMFEIYMYIYIYKLGVLEYYKYITSFGYSVLVYT